MAWNGHVALARGAAVVLGEVDVVDLGQEAADRAQRVLLLDVGVEGVVEGAVIGLADLAHDRGGVGQRVEGVALEAVERLDRELDAQTAGRRSAAARWTSTRPRALGRGGRLAGELAERLVERAGQDLATGGGKAVAAPSAAGSTAPWRDGGLGADGAAGGVGQDRDAGAAQALLADDPADAREMLRLALEDRQLDAVVAGTLERCEQREVLLDRTWVVQSRRLKPRSMAASPSA